MRLREMRKQLGLSQAQLAKLVGVTQATISLWELGSAAPTMKGLRKLVQIFNCTSDELLGTKNSQASP